MNVASRLEGANKLYGTHIIIGPETRRLAGDRVLVRELDRLAVYGRAGGLQIYELLDVTDTPVEAPEWISSYQAGLTSLRARDFPAAIAAFERAANLRTQDQASSIMIERCKKAMLVQLDEEWDGTAIAPEK